jgi:ABC-type lipoprotein release transport system permease subunit
MNLVKNILSLLAVLGLVFLAVGSLFGNIIVPLTENAPANVQSDIRAAAGRGVSPDENTEGAIVGNYYVPQFRYRSFPSSVEYELMPPYKPHIFVSGLTLALFFQLVISILCAAVSLALIAGMISKPKKAKLRTNS